MAVGLYNNGPQLRADATDLLTRLKARGPSRFVSVEKVREVAMKVASNVWGQARGMRPTKPKTKAEVEAELTAIVDAQLAEVTT